jgi:transposase
MKTTRRRFSREFKIEAVRLVRERGVTLAQAARELLVHVNLLRGWVRAHRDDPAHAFPGEEQQKPEVAEVTRLRRSRAVKKWSGTS